jgi:hypothetical protein
LFARVGVGSAVHELTPMLVVVSTGQIVAV